MGFRAFLNELSESGCVRLDDTIAPTAAEIAACDDLFTRDAAACAIELAGKAPPIRIEAVRWAAARLYAGAVFFVRRDIDASIVQSNLSVACPGPKDASTLFSVDIYFRLLPDLITLAHGLAQDDPLVESLKKIAVEWPLSSVGVRGLGTISDVDSIWSHDGLRQLYVDRVIQHADDSRLSDPRVRDAIDQTLGLYPQLAGKLKFALDSMNLQLSASNTNADKGPHVS